MGESCAVQTRSQPCSVLRCPLEAPSPPPLLAFELTRSMIIPYAVKALFISFSIRGILVSAPPHRIAHTARVKLRSDLGESRSREKGRGSASERLSGMLERGALLTPVRPGLTRSHRGSMSNKAEHPIMDEIKAFRRSEIRSAISFRRCKRAPMTRPFFSFSPHKSVK